MMDLSSTESGASRAEHKAGRANGGSSMIREELVDLKSDLDALMAHAATLTETELREARDRMMARFSSMRFAAKGLANQASKQFNEGVDVTTDYVRQKPLQSVAIAGAIGILLGVMVGVIPRR